ncbi:coiled-coil domain-containing protein 96 isoform X2 [Xenopus tropicalis]|uniref:Coiled-coil domain-containing protein 96 isoform X2 n=1 Tax=Xenopus tropicalis TaxID=8364 RepID=A0A8J1J012_XENTR|nr:coiled-coil domain-containing protein 96 isoform X2 [Xenopus tropicalis]
MELEPTGSSDPALPDSVQEERDADTGVRENEVSEPTRGEEHGKESETGDDNRRSAGIKDEAETGDDNGRSAGIKDEAEIGDDNGRVADIEDEAELAHSGEEGPSEMVDLPAEGSVLETHGDGAGSRSSVHSREDTTERAEEEATTVEEVAVSGEEVMDTADLASVKQWNDSTEPSLEQEPTAGEEEVKVEAEPQILIDNVEVLEGEEEDPDDKERREELIQQYQALIQERDKVQQHNAQLQNKLYEYFRRKKGEDLRPETEKRISDQEQRYLKYLTSLEEMKKKNMEDAAMHQQQIEELEAQCLEVVSRVDKEMASFQEHKKSVALLAYKHFGAGKHASSAFTEALAQLQAKEDRKEKEVTQVHLENIKLKNQISQFQSTLRSKEELAEGLHLIDFEQLKIENQTYNEKIEERNEELLKLRKKITSTVHTLTHVKEKLQFMQAENQEKKDQLMEVEAVLANKRDILTKTKQARDSLRRDNLKLKQRSGLLDNKLLLKDFEDKVDETEVLSQKLESLKRRHAELSLSGKGLMKKIEEGNLALKN